MKFYLHFLSHYMRYALLIAYSLIGYATLSGQTLDQDLASIREAYLNTPAYSIRVHFALYQAGAVQPLEDQNAIFAKRGNNFTMHNQPRVEVYNTTDYMLMVDHENRVIFLSQPRNPSTDSTVLLKLSPAAEFDSLLANAQRFQQLRVESDSSVIYTFTFVNHSYDKVIMEFRKRNFFLIKNIIVFSENVPPNIPAQSILETRYEELSFDEDIILSFFNNNRYVQRQGNTWVPTVAYQDFKFLNQLD